MNRASTLLITCEHGGNRVPRPWAGCVRLPRRTLQSHRGWDYGALPLARHLARTFVCPLMHSTTTRLLIDLNRSLTNPSVFSEYSRTLPLAHRERLIKQCYAPYRARVRASIEQQLKRGEAVLHLAVHSFTPHSKPPARMADIGLLYDPARQSEQTFCAAWQRALRTELPGFRIRRNAPYRGATDGLTTSLRTELSNTRYLGIELEVNQARLHPERRRAAIYRALANTLRRLRDRATQV